MHLTYSSSLSRFCEINSSFDMGVLRVAYTNRNRNGSFISKETYERCLETIYNCPIVCNYDRDTDTIGAHDVEIVKGKDGDLRIVNVTTPVGVVPESAEPFWETVEEDDGTIHEYLCVDVLLWKRQEAYKKIKEDGISAESMEITVKDGETDTQSGLFVIKDFEFTAFCILGEDVEPCFESASLEVFSCGGFKLQMEQMIAELKETLSTAGVHPDDGLAAKQNYSMEGGEVLDEKLGLVAEYGLNVDDLDFSIVDYSIEELREKFDAMKAETTQVDGNDGAEDAAAETFELNGQFTEVLISTLEEQKVETCFGEMSKYWFVDFDAEVGEVYCYDCEDWKLYGLKYSMNGDNVVIDYDSKRRMKYAIVEFDDGDQPSPFASVFELAVNSYSANDNTWAERYQEATDKIGSMENDLQELSDLRRFKSDTEATQRDAAVDSIFTKFSDLEGIDAFEALRDNNSNLSLEDLEEKCFAIRGRNGSHANFALEQKAPKLPVNETEMSDDEPYGGIVARYTKK